jgi:hypothetical protein
MNIKRSYISHGLLVMLVSLPAHAQSSRYTVQEKDTIRRTLEFSGSGNRTIELDNVSGSIHVAGTNGRSVEMVANRTIRAESQDRVRDAQRDVQLDIADGAETVRIYVNGPFRCNCSNGSDGWRSFGARWNDPGYRVDMDFDLTVPQGTKLRLRTVNSGDITVENTSGDFEVENVNGKIIMTDIRGSGRAETVNGRVTVSFAENPKSDSSFKSTNGAIEVSFQPNLSANLQMKTFNGGLFTDFDVTSLPNAAPSAERVNGRFVYRRNSFSGFRVGSGGPEIKFDGFNGDVRVLRRTR